MNVSTSQLQELLVDSLLVEQIDLGKVQIPDVLSAYISSINEDPTLNDITRIPISYIDTLSSLFKTVIATNSCFLGKPNKPVQDVIKTTIAGCSLIGFLTVLKYHVYAIPYYIDNINDKLRDLRRTMQQDDFLNTCFKLLKVCHYMTLAARVFDIMALEFGNVMQCPPLSNDIQGFCATVKNLIGNADAIKSGILERRSTALNEVQFNQLGNSLKDVVVKYGVIFDNFSSNIKSNFVSSFSEQQFSIFQHFLSVQINYFTNCVFVAINLLLFDTSKIADIIEPFVKLATCMFQIGYSFSKVARFRCDFNLEIKNLNDSYFEIIEQISSVKDSLYKNFVNEFQPAKAFADIVFTAEYEKIKLVSKSFAQNLNNFISGVKADKRFLLYKVISPKEISSPITSLGNELIVSINDLYFHFIDESTPMNQFDIDINSIKENLKEFSQKITNIISKLSKLSDKRRLQHFPDSLTLSLGEITKQIKLYMSNESKDNKYISLSVLMAIYNMQIEFCCMDIDSSYIDTLKILKKDLYSQLNSLPKLYFDDFVNTSKLCLEIDEIKKDKINLLVIKDIILYINEIIEEPLVECPADFYKQLNTLFVLMEVLLIRIPDNSNEAKILKSQVTFLGSFLRLFKRMAHVYVFAYASLISSMETNGILMLNQIIQQKSNLLSEKIIITEQLSAMKLLEEQLNEIKESIIIRDFEINKLFEKFKPMLQPLVKIFTVCSEFKDIPHLVSLFENNLENIKTFVNEFDEIKEFEYFFSDKIYSELKQQLFAGPFILNQLNEIMKSISAIKPTIQSNRQLAVLLSFELGEKVLFVHPYFSLIDKTIDISRYYYRNSIEIINSLTSLFLGDSHEIQNANGILLNLSKETQELIVQCKLINEQINDFYSEDKTLLMTQMEFMTTEEKDTTDIKLPDLIPVMKFEDKTFDDIKLPELPSMFQQIENEKDNNKEDEQKKPEIKEDDQKKPEIKEDDQKKPEIKEEEQKKPEIKEDEQKKPEIKEDEQKKPEIKEETMVKNNDENSISKEDEPIRIDIKFPPSSNNFLKVPFEFVSSLATGVKSDLSGEILPPLIIEPLECYETEIEFPLFDEFPIDPEIPKSQTSLKAKSFTNLSNLPIHTFQSTPSNQHISPFGFPPPDNAISTPHSFKFAQESSRPSSPFGLQPPEIPSSSSPFNLSPPEIPSSSSPFGFSPPDNPISPHPFKFGQEKKMSPSPFVLQPPEIPSSSTPFNLSPPEIPSTTNFAFKKEKTLTPPPFFQTPDQQASFGFQAPAFDINIPPPDSETRPESPFNLPPPYPDEKNNNETPIFPQMINFNFEPSSSPQPENSFSQYIDQNNNSNFVFLDNSGDVEGDNDDSGSEYYTDEDDDDDDDDESELESSGGLIGDINEESSIQDIAKQYLKCLKDDLNIIKSNLQNYNPEENNSFFVQTAFEASLRVETTITNIENLNE